MGGTQFGGLGGGFQGTPRFESITHQLNAVACRSARSRHASLGPKRCMANLGYRRSQQPISRRSPDDQQRRRLDNGELLIPDAVSTDQPDEFSLPPPGKTWGRRLALAPEITRLPQRLRQGQLHASPQFLARGFPPIRLDASRSGNYRRHLLKPQFLSLPVWLPRFDSPLQFRLWFAETAGSLY
jgi:hypothetical protein